MGSEKKTNMNKDDRSSSSPKYGGQQYQNPDKRQPDSQADQNKQGSGMNRSKFEKQDQRNADGKKDVDDERHPEEQVTKPKEYKKDDQKYGDKSEGA